MITGQIDSLAFGGDGILRHQGLVIFVPFTAPQDLVEVEIVRKKKNHARAKIKQLQRPSVHRSEPLCPVFGQCGGCHFQHLNYSQQLESKRQFIQDALQRIGGITIQVPPVIEATEQWHYRKHIKLKLLKSASCFKCGFVATDRQSLITIKSCQIFNDDLFLEKLGFYLSRLDSEYAEEDSVRIVKTSVNRYFLAFSFSSELPKNSKAIAELMLSELEELEGIAMQSSIDLKTYGTINAEVQYGSFHFRFSPFGFLQNHYEQSQKLYQAAIAAIGSCEGSILDLYCGIGITTLMLAGQCSHIIGIESHEQTVELALQNAERNQINNADFICARVEDKIDELLGKFQPECILMNPPRTGVAEELITTISKHGVSRIIYISCMPATLARDLKAFRTKGYALESIQAFDLFPQTTHVEMLSVIVKN
jgi:23S rRNA (uracil1939-C5)-methyltransferase